MDSVHDDQVSGSNGVVTQELHGWPPEGRIANTRGRVVDFDDVVASRVEES